MITTSYILLSGSVPDSSGMKWLVWGGTWRHKRMEAIRFGLVALGASGGAARSPADPLLGPRAPRVPGAAAGAGKDTGTGRPNLSRTALTDPTLTGIW